MKLRSLPTEVRGERASVFILVLWISFGLVALALYFADSMGFELRAADNRAASVEAEQAIAGAVRYVSRVVTNVDTPGKFPDVTAYQTEDVPVGEASFWLIGRGDTQTTPTVPVFGLADEAGKLNLNTATVDMLAALPRMTPQLAAAIIDWRDVDSNVNTNGGAEDDTYARLTPSRHCKNARFETVEELRLVYGMDLEILLGEDSNLNGALDTNENDGDTALPSDNRDGKLDPGLFEYVTVYSRQSNKNSQGQLRVDIRTAQSRQKLAAVLQQKFEARRANQILGAIGQITVQSVLEFFIRTQMTTDEATQIASEICASGSAYTEGLVNVNTASEAVLSCIPGIGTTNASSLISYRQSNPDKLTSVAWLTQVLSPANAIQAGRYVTAATYTFSADIAAVGHHGRGYQRVKFILDTSSGSARILFRRDLSHLGWALGAQTRENILLSMDSR